MLCLRRNPKLGARGFVTRVARTRNDHARKGRIACARARNRIAAAWSTARATSPPLTVRAIELLRFQSAPSCVLSSPSVRVTAAAGGPPYGRGGADRHHFSGLRNVKSWPNGCAKYPAEYESSHTASLLVWQGSIIETTGLQSPFTVSFHWPPAR